MAKKTKNDDTYERNQRANSRRLLTNDSPFAIREAYVKLRTSLMCCMTADTTRPCTAFAISSAVPSEGKSLTAANIAVSFAMMEKNTLLIDADFRKPTMRRLWDINQRTGLCDFLIGSAPLQLTRLQDIPLTIAPSGSIPPNPSELLASAKMRQFVTSCAEHYDYIIIDTPPVDTVADAQIISTLVDGFVLVARSGYTSRSELSSAIAAIQDIGGNICGIVLNNLSQKSVRYSYRYKYRYGYGYGGRYGSKYGSRYGSRYSYRYGYGRKRGYGYGYGSPEASRGRYGYEPDVQDKKGKTDAPQNTGTPKAVARTAAPAPAQTTQKQPGQTTEKLPAQDNKQS